MPEPSTTENALLRERRARTLSGWSVVPAIAWLPVTLMAAVVGLSSVPMYGHQDRSLLGLAAWLMAATVIVPLLGIGLALAARSYQPHHRAAVCLWLNGIFLCLSCIKFLPT